MLAHQLNSKSFYCIQAVKLTVIRLQVVFVHQLNSKGLNCIQAVKLK